MSGIKVENLFRVLAGSFHETTMLRERTGFRIPEYQREYDWSDQHINRLFSDCLIGFDRLFKDPGNSDCFTFLGMLILVKENEGGTGEKDFQGESLSVVDGQQRLTTLALFACALYESIRKAQKKLQIPKLDIGGDEKSWLDGESEWRLEKLLECISGTQPVKRERPLPFPRIVRAGTDTRGRSEAEYESPLGRFLQSFAKFVDDDETGGSFPTPDEDAVKLCKNYKLIRRLVKNINNADWYEDMECEQAPAFDEQNKAGYRSLFPQLGRFVGGEDAQQETISNLQKYEEVRGFVRLLLFSAYFCDYIVLTRVTVEDENTAFDIFDALNTTGEPLTALETLRPRVLRFEKDLEQEGSSSESNLGRIKSPWGIYTDVVGSSEGDLERIKEYIDQKYVKTPAKQKETKDLVVSFALYLAGEKLPGQLGAQRKFLRKQYQETTTDSPGAARRYVRLLADLAQFRWVYYTSAGLQKLADYHPPEDVEEVEFLMTFIRATKTTLILPILARYWKPDMGDDADSGKRFLQALRAVTAFLVIRRAASGKTEGIDGDFRAVMSLPNEDKDKIKKFGLCAGVVKDNTVLGIKDLKKALRHLLAESKFSIKPGQKEHWLGQVVSKPLYEDARSIVRFMMLAAAEQADPDEDNPGCWSRAGLRGDLAKQSLTLEEWERYEVVEHVAPESPPQDHKWPAKIYEDVDLRHSLGNLVLLPRMANAEVGNSSWEEKRACYRAVNTGEDNNKITLLEDDEELRLLQPLLRVDKWDRDLIRSRSRNIAGLAWDYLWEWLK